MSATRRTDGRADARARTEGLRGELSRWLIEPKANVFVGNVPASVRDKLWDMACKDAKGGAALLLFSTNNEQGFNWRLWGDPAYHPEDFEGLLLVRRPAG